MYNKKDTKGKTTFIAALPTKKTAASLPASQGFSSLGFESNSKPLLLLMKFAAVECAHPSTAAAASSSSKTEASCASKETRLRTEKKAFVQHASSTLRIALQHCANRQFDAAHGAVNALLAAPLFAAENSAPRPTNSVDVSVAALRRLTMRINVEVAAARHDWRNFARFSCELQAAKGSSRHPHREEGSFFWSRMAHAALCMRHFTLARVALAQCARTKPQIYARRLRYLAQKMGEFCPNRSSTAASRQTAQRDAPTHADRRLIDEAVEGACDANAATNEASVPHVLLSVAPFEEAAAFFGKVEAARRDSGVAFPALDVRFDAKQFSFSASSASSASSSAFPSSSSSMAGGGFKNRRSGDSCDSQPVASAAIGDVVEAVKCASRYAARFAEAAAAAACCEDDAAFAPKSAASSPQPPPPPLRPLHIAAFLRQTTLGCAPLLEATLVHVTTDALWFVDGPFVGNAADALTAVTFLVKAAVQVAAADPQWPWRNLRSLAAICVLIFEFLLFADEPQTDVRQASLLLLRQFAAILQHTPSASCCFLTPLVRFAVCVTQGGLPADDIEDFAIPLQNSLLLGAGAAAATVTKASLLHIQQQATVRAHIANSILLPLQQASSKEHLLVVPQKVQQCIASLDATQIAHFKGFSFLLCTLKCRHLLLLGEFLTAERALADFFTLQPVDVWSFKKHNAHFLSIVLQEMVHRSSAYVPSFEFCRFLCGQLENFEGFLCSEAKLVLVSMLHVLCLAIENDVAEELVSKIHSLLASFRTCLTDKGMLLAFLLGKLPLNACDAVPQGPAVNCMKCLFNFQFVLRPNGAEHYDEYDATSAACTARNLLQTPETRNFVAKIYCCLLRENIRHLTPSSKDFRQADVKRTIDFLKKTFLDKTQSLPSYRQSVSYDGFVRFVDGKWFSACQIPFKSFLTVEEEAEGCVAALHHLFGKLAAWQFRASKTKGFLYENDFVVHFEISQSLKPTAGGWHTLAHAYHDMAIAYCTAQHSPAFMRKNVAHIANLFSRSITCFDALQQFAGRFDAKNLLEFRKYDEKRVLNFFYFLFLAKIHAPYAKDRDAIRLRCLAQLEKYFSTHAQTAVRSWRAAYWRAYFLEKQKASLMPTIALYLFALTLLRKTSKYAEDKGFPIVYKVTKLLYKAASAKHRLIGESGAEEILRAHCLLPAAATAKEYAGLSAFESCCVNVLLHVATPADRKKQPEHRALLVAAGIALDAHNLSLAADVLHKALQFKKASLGVGIWKNGLQLYLKHHRYVQAFCTLYARCIACDDVAASGSLVSRDHFLRLLHASAEDMTMFARETVEQCAAVLYGHGTGLEKRS